MCEKHPDAEENATGACKECVAEYFEIYFQRKKAQIDEAQAHGDIWNTLESM